MAQVFSCEFCEIFKNTFFTEYLWLRKVYENSDKERKNPLKYIIPIHFDNRELEFIHLNFILNENNIINCLSESLWEDEIS